MSEDEFAWTGLWRLVDIGPNALVFHIENVGSGSVARRVRATGWLGYHLAEEALRRCSMKTDNSDLDRFPPMGWSRRTWESIS